MELLALPLLFVAMVVLAVVPGPGVFAVVARSIASGFSHGAMTSVGIICGDFVFILLAIYGLSAASAYLGNLFSIVGYLGGIYLIWLGISLWRIKPQAFEVKAIAEPSWQSNFLAGLFVTLSNPKAILFYAGFFPAFLDLSALSVMDTLLIMAVALFAVGGTMLVYAYIASRAKKAFQSARAERLINLTAGSVMLATGLFLFTTV